MPTVLMQHLQPDRPDAEGSATVVNPPQAQDGKVHAEPHEIAAHQPLHILSDVINGMVEEVPATDGVEVTQDGTVRTSAVALPDCVEKYLCFQVLNEEGLPFMDIREPVAAPTPPARKIGQDTAASDRAVGN